MDHCNILKQYAFVEANGDLSLAKKLLEDERKSSQAIPVEMDPVWLKAIKDLEELIGQS